MKNKKQIIIITSLLLAAFILTALPGFAAIGKKRVVKEVVNAETVYIEEVHNVVAGSARYHTNYANETSGWNSRKNANFYDNFVYDGFVEYGSWENLSDTDKEYLQTVTGLQNGVSCESRYFIDLTTQTVSARITIPFIAAERREWGNFKPERGLKWWEDDEGLQAIHDKYKFEGSGSSMDELQQQMEQAGFGSGTQVVDVQEKTIVTYEYPDPYTIVELHTTTRVVTNKKVTYQIVLSLFDYTPLVLDLDNNNKIDTAKNEWLPHSPKFYPIYAKLFDISGDGNPNFTEWTAINPSDGILAMPENGKVDSALQLFGNAGGYKDGFEKLSIVCDKDKNGWVEGEELDGLVLWIDENHNAICEASEMKNLKDYGVEKIGTKHSEFVGSYVTADGTTHKMWDWWPAAYETRRYK